MVRQILRGKSSRLGRILSVGLFLSLGLSLFPACTAPDPDKKGFEGEFCGKDSDCRDLLVCDSTQNKCSEGNIPLADSCRAICDRRANTCNSKEKNCADGNHYLCCYKSCRATAKNWSEKSINDFESCFINDLTCEEVIKDSAPSDCVNRMPLPRVREQVCDRFERRARNISSNTDAIDKLRLECRILARTGTEEKWKKAAVCNESSLGSKEFVDCVNKTFTDLKPKLVYDMMEPLPEDVEPQ